MPTTTVERSGRSAIVRLRGDVTLATSRKTWAAVRPLLRKEYDPVVLDFSGAGRLDSSALALVSMLRRQLASDGRTLEIVELGDQHEAVLALAPTEMSSPAVAPPRVGLFELIGDQVFGKLADLRAFAALIKETLRQGVRVATRRERLPAGAITDQIERMGFGALGIVGLLSFLLGMTMSFQGAVQLQRVGAGPYVADMIGVTMVRELSPLITAIILTGRTGAAIAAELGTMRVRSEIDALATMGISPIRYLVVPRMAAILFVGPALSLFSMFVGCLGGMLVAAFALDLSPITFWQRMVERLIMDDFWHGLWKSSVFAALIGLVGSHLGMRANADASSVGLATTRTVVICIFGIVIVDAIFATISTLMRYP